MLQILLTWEFLTCTSLLCFVLEVRGRRGMTYPSLNFPDGLSYPVTRETELEEMWGERRGRKQERSFCLTFEWPGESLFWLCPGLKLYPLVLFQGFRPSPLLGPLTQLPQLRPCLSLCWLLMATLYLLQQKVHL